MTYNAAVSPPIATFLAAEDLDLFSIVLIKSEDGFELTILFKVINIPLAKGKEDILDIKLLSYYFLDPLERFTKRITRMITAMSASAAMAMITHAIVGGCGVGSSLPDSSSMSN